MNTRIFSQRDKVVNYDLKVTVYTQPQRAREAIIKLLTLWGVAIASILIPVFHFVLVPTFFLIGPFLAYKTYKKEVAIEACEIPCPECGQLAQFSKNSGKWPLHATCPHCRNRIYFDASV